MTALPESVRTLGALLEQRAGGRGDETFFHLRGTQYTHEDLDRSANVIANQLAENGVEAGDVICIYMYNRPEYLYTLFALAKIGTIADPIDTRFTDETLAHELAETDTDIVILDGDTEPEYEAIRNETDTISTEFFVGEGASQGPYRDFDLLLNGNGATTPDVDIDGSDTCSVLYVQRYQRAHPQGVELPHYPYINTGKVSYRNLLELSEDLCLHDTSVL